MTDRYLTSSGAGLADLLAERPPEREARRLATWIRVAGRHSPLARDPALAAALGGRADTIVAALARALAAPDPGAASALTEEARRALFELRALLAIAHADGVLHEVQLALLTEQAGRAGRALAVVALRARTLVRAAAHAEATVYGSPGPARPRAAVVRP